MDWIQDHQMFRRRTAASIALILLLLLSFIPPQPVQAGAVIRVSPTPKGLEFAPDEYDANANFCSLREAIVAANTDRAFGGCIAGSGADTIIIPAGRYQLTRPGSAENGAATGDLDIRGNTTLVGAGSGTGGTWISIAKSVGDRVFDISTPGISVNISNLKISGGFIASTDGGGGILINGATVSLDRVVITENSVSPTSVGGGITNLSGSRLTISNSTISSNLAGYGGGIYNNGRLVITNSLIFSNSANIDGGGMVNSTSPDSPNDTASVTNTTIASNLNNGGGAGIANSGPFSLVNSTVVNNAGIGLFLNDIGMRVQNTIIARNAPGSPNCFVVPGKPQPVSLGYNLIGENNSPAECKFTAGTDQVGVTSEELALAPSIENNGGPTQTYRILTGSVAIDKVPLAACPGTDQRGYIRPAGPLCDIGAYEGGAKPPDKKVFLPAVINR